VLLLVRRALVLAAAAKVQIAIDDGSAAERASPLRRAPRRNGPGAAASPSVASSSSSFETTMRSMLSALTSAQEGLARLNVPPDAIPQTRSSCSFILRVLAEYARRGREALSRHGLDAAE